MESGSGSVHSSRYLGDSAALERSINHSDLGSIHSAVDLVEQRQLDSSRKVLNDIDQLIAELDSEQDNSSSKSYTSAIQQWSKKVQDSCKSVHSATAKLSKAVEKCAPTDGFSECLPPGAGNEDCILRALYHSFAQQGLAEVSSTLLEEAPVEQNNNLQPNMSSSFLELCSLAQDIVQGETNAALQWLESSIASNFQEVSCNSASEKSIESRRHSLLRALFCIRRARFASLLQDGDVVGAIVEMRMLPIEAKAKYQHELECLLTNVVLYTPAGDKEVLPVAGDPQAKRTCDSMNEVKASLSRASVWWQTSQEFLKNVTHSQGMPSHDSLFTTVRIGCDVIPQIRSVNTIRQSLKGNGPQAALSIWDTQDGASSMPVHLELQPGARKHSTFVCPVSKEQATPSNPPVVLACGHAILRQSLSNLKRPGSL